MIQFRKLATALLLLLAASSAAQELPRELVDSFCHASGEARLQLANTIFERLDEAEVTDSLIVFDSRTTTDSLLAHTLFWVAEERLLGGRYAESTGYFEQALEHISEKDLVWRGDCMSDLAIAYARTGLFSQATRMATETIKCDEELGDNERLSISLNIMGSILIMARQPAEAEKYVLRALRLDEARNDSLKMAMRYGVLSELAFTSTDYEQAADMALEALRLDSLRGDATKMAVRRVQLANALARQQQPAEAMRLLRQSLPVLQQAGLSSSEAICQAQMGMLLLDDGHWTEAEHAFRQALTIYLRAGDRYGEQKCRWGLWQALRHTNLALAAEQLEAYALLKDSLYQQDVLNVTADYDARYHNEELNRQAEQAKAHSRQVVLVASMLLLILLIIVAALLYGLRQKSRSARMQQLLRQAHDRFFANITHELRTPLTIVLGYGRRLRQEPQPAVAELATIGGAIEREGGQLLNLVNQLLDMQRTLADTQQQPPQWVRADIARYVGMTAERYAHYARLQGVTLTCEAVPASIDMDFVQDYIDHIVRNLVGNALKFTPQGGAVRLSLQATDGTVVLEVADTGCGFDAADLPHVFDLFYQGSNSSSHVHPGTGIGLSYVKQLAERMGGSVSARNNDGAGASVSVRLPQHNPKADTVPLSSLPAAMDQAAQTATAGTLAAPSGTPACEAEGELLLVVEDNDDMAAYFHSLLDRRYRVATARNGVEGLDKAEQLLPSLIITDLMMPQMDGYELCRQLRQSDELNHIPIIVVTALADDRNRLQAIGAGVSAFLLKPFDAEELLMQVQRLLSERQLLKQKFSQSVLRGDEQPRGLTDGEQQFLSRLTAVARKGIGNSGYTVLQLASDLCMSYSKLNRMMHNITNQSATAFLTQLRLEKALKMVETTEMPIGEVAAVCGFDDHSYFSRLFKQAYGSSPKDYRAKTKSKNND